MSDNEQKGLSTVQIGGSMIHEDGRRPAQASQDIGLSRLVFYTGTAQDKKRYGPLPDGTFLDEMEMTQFGDKVVICFVGYVGTTYSKWSNDQATPEYSYNSWKEVVEAGHKSDFEWDDSGRKPSGVETVSIIVLMLNSNHVPVGPYVMNLKRTSLPVWDSGRFGIKKNENAASLKGQACIFELGSEDDKNAAKQDFKRMTCRLVKRILPTDELYDPLMQLRSGFESLRNRAKAMGDEPTGNQHEEELPV